MEIVEQQECGVEYPVDSSVLCERAAQHIGMHSRAVTGGTIIWPRHNQAGYEPFPELRAAVARGELN